MDGWQLGFRTKLNVFECECGGWREDVFITRVQRTVTTKRIKKVSRSDGERMTNGERQKARAMERGECKCSA